MQLLVDLIKYNREHGNKTDTEIIEAYIDAFNVLNKYRDTNGKINIELALNEINLQIKQIKNTV